MDGIFFDETPSAYSSEMYAYLSNLTPFARTPQPTYPEGNESSSPQPSSKSIIFNPGAVLGSRYYALADYINAFENSWGAYTDKVLGWIPRIYWKQTTFMIYGFTDTCAKHNETVRNLKGKIAGLFLSTKSAYDAVSEYWGEFAGEMV